MTAPLLALVVSAVLGPAVLVGLRRWAVVDVPNDRSSHAAATPRGGGLAVAMAATVAVAVGSHVSSTGRVALAAGPLAFAALGMADDVLPVGAVRRLALQVVLAGATVWLLLDGMTASVAWRVAAVLAAVTWIVSLVNAWNFMDGIDGLAAVTAIVAGATWWVVGDREDIAAVQTAGAILAASAAGFLPLNFPRARVFLGDVGSYFLGAWAAAVVLIGLRAGIAPIALAAPTAPFLADTGLTLLQRLRRRERLHVAHREHAYQRLVIEHRWSHIRTTMVVALVTIACSTIGVAGAEASVAGQAVAVIGVAVVAAAYVALPAVLASICRERR